MTAPTTTYLVTWDEDDGMQSVEMYTDREIADLQGPKDTPVAEIHQRVGDDWICIPSDSARFTELVGDNVAVDERPTLSYFVGVSLVALACAALAAVCVEIGLAVLRYAQHRTEYEPNVMLIAAGSMAAVCLAQVGIVVLRVWGEES